MRHLLVAVRTAFVSFLLMMLVAGPAQAQEMIIGEEVIEPGIQLVFEGAPKDDVTPHDQNLAEDKTDVHLEVLTTWATDESVEIPEGATRGGFVGYLHFFATIAMHYARNVSLPGASTDPYTVTFDVRPPEETELAFHKSWRDAHGTPLFEAQSFTYETLDFEEIAAATRR